MSEDYWFEETSDEEEEFESAPMYDPDPRYDEVKYYPVGLDYEGG